MEAEFGLRIRHSKPSDTGARGHSDPMDVGAVNSLPLGKGKGSSSPRVIGVVSAVEHIFNDTAMHARAQASNRLAKANRASHGPRVRVKARFLKKENPTEPKVRTKVPKACTGAIHRTLVSQVFKTRNQREDRKLRNLHRHVPLSLPGAMVGMVTSGTMAGVLMSGMMTGVLLDGTKVGNKRMTLPQAHFLLEGEDALGHRSCSEHIPIELWSRRSKRWKILSGCQW